MEKTNGKLHTENLVENSMMFGKLYTEGATTMMDTYKKQMDYVFGLYSDYFNSMMGESKNMMNPAKTFTDLFINNNPMKWMFFPFNNLGSTVSFRNPYEKMLNQFTDQNQNMLDAFTKQFEKSQDDFKDLNEKYQDKIGKQSEILRKMLHSMSDAYSKQMTSYIESTTKLQEEIAKQTNLLLKVNQEFWSDVFKSYQIPFDMEIFSDNGRSERKKAHKAHVHN